MKLELIKNSNSTQASKPENILYDFLKNNLKKDLEVTFWRNKACIIFGEFDFFSDYNAELNSFDYTVSMLFEMPVPLKEDSIEYKISTNPILNCFQQTVNHYNIDLQFSFLCTLFLYEALLKNPV